MNSSSDMPDQLRPQEVARRLVRSRNWHLVQHARLRSVALTEYALVHEEAQTHQAQGNMGVVQLIDLGVTAMRRFDDEAYAHQLVAGEIADTLFLMGFDPQPPMGPRSVA